MRNFVQQGDHAEVPAPAGGAKSGQAVAMNGMVGVATADAAEGKLLVVKLDGVYALPADPSAAFAQFDDLYWDATNKRVTKTAAGNPRAGVAWTAKAEGAAAANVRLRAGVK